MQLALQEIDGTLRLVNPRNGEVLKTYSENDAAARQSRERAEQEYRARVAAEQEIVRLRAELDKLRGNQS